MSLRSSAYPQPECDQSALPGPRWPHLQRLPTGGKLSTKRGRKERARARERGPVRSQVCQDMSRQLAAELRSCGRELRRIAASFPHSCPLGSSWGRGGDVSAPPRPRLPGADGVLQWVGLPGSCGCRRQGCRRPPYGCGVDGRSVPRAVLLPAESSGFSQALVFLAPSTRAAQGPAARTSRVSQPPRAAFPTPRTAGDALPLLQLKLVATCRLPDFRRAEA